MAFDSFIAGGIEMGFLGALDTLGYLKGGNNAAPAAGNQAGSPMIRIKGLTNADPTIPQPDIVNFPGDDGSEGTMAFPSESSPVFNVDKSIFNLAQDAFVQNTSTYDDGGIRMGVLKPQKNDPEDCCWILQSLTKKKDSGLSGLKAWSGYIVPISQVYPTGRQAFASRAAGVDRYRVITSPADQLPNGVAIDTANFLVEGGCIIPFDNDYPIYMHRWTGNNTAASYDLAYPPAEYTSAQIRIRVDGVLQTFGTAYIITSGLTIVFQSGHIPGSNSKIVGLIGIDPNG